MSARVSVPLADLDLILNIPAELTEPGSLSATVKNLGPSTATGVVVTSELPAGVVPAGPVDGCTGSATVTCRLPDIGATVAAAQAASLRGGAVRVAQVATASGRGRVMRLSPVATATVRGGLVGVAQVADEVSVTIPVKAASTCRTQIGGGEIIADVTSTSVDDVPADNTSKGQAMIPIGGVDALRLGCP